MKLKSIQAVRAIACLSVVIYHLFALSKDYAGGAFYQPFLAIGKGGVDIFFVVSGVVMVVTSYARFGADGSARDFAIARIARIYPPYWFLTILLTLYWLYNPGGVNADHGGVDLFASYTLLPSHALPLVPVAWTLSYEMMFYVVFFSLMILIPIKRLPVALLAWGLLVTIGNLLLSGFQVDNLYLSFIANLYVLEFIAGCFIGLAYKTGRLKAGAIPLIAALIWFSTSAVLLQINEILDGFRGWSRVAFYSVPSVLFVYGLLALEVTGVWTRIPNWLVSAGNASYSLYLTHILFIHVAYRVAFKSVFASNGFIFLPFCMIASFVVGGVFYRLIEIPTTGFAREMLSRLLAQKSVRPRVVSP
ncbi:acyltransferase family protein [Rhizobium sp. 9140]|uniref:acyltransferase family protein n=1 Tax=Rhizobium sp. 9140 TaxID=1761900 RepID=UPI000793E019|nr:acyltransferase [Rhizobium sp. 9140]CZT36074.1 Peptidoglycan/LPS O-acetylase OafA/YrhL, contains acyltransferase and SGNH-hydrolase domains [Rhizobium sp. 9140]